MEDGRMESHFKVFGKLALEQEITNLSSDIPENSSCSNDSGISEGIGLFEVKSNPSLNFQNLQLQTQRDIACSSSYSSSESENGTDSYTSDDSSGDNERSWLSSSISLSMGHCSLHYVPPVNATEKPLSKFEGFISNEWPEGWRGELEVLEMQLTHGGDFNTNMKVIDLSTPAFARLDSKKVLDLLEHKIMNNKYTLKHVGKLVLPDVSMLTSGDEVKIMIGDYCRVLCGKEPKVQIEEVIIKCDEVSSKFVPGDLKWIEGFSSYNNLGAIAVSSFSVNMFMLYLQFVYRYFVLRKVRTQILKDFVSNFVGRKRSIITLRKCLFKSDPH